MLFDASYSDLNAGSNFNLFISIFTFHPLFSFVSTILLSLATVLMRTLYFKLIFSSIVLNRDSLFLNFRIFLAFILFNSFVYLTDAELAVFNHVNSFISFSLLYIASLFLFRYLLSASSRHHLFISISK